MLRPPKVKSQELLTGNTVFVYVNGIPMIGYPTTWIIQTTSVIISIAQALEKNNRVARWVIGQPLLLPD